MKLKCHFCGQFFDPALVTPDLVEAGMCSEACRDDDELTDKAIAAFLGWKQP